MSSSKFSDIYRHLTSVRWAKHVSDERLAGDAQKNPEKVLITGAIVVNFLRLERDQAWSFAAVTCQNPNDPAEIIRDANNFQAADLQFSERHKKWVAVISSLITDPEDIYVFEELCSGISDAAEARNRLAHYPSGHYHFRPNDKGEMQFHSMVMSRFDKKSKSVVRHERTVSDLWRLQAKIVDYSSGIRSVTMKLAPSAAKIVI